MDMGKKGLYMIQSLVFAYIATGILLCLLAFIIYQSNAGMKIANLGVTLTYILASVFAGMLIGSKIGKKKFSRGFFKKISFCFPQKGSQHVSYVLQEELQVECLLFENEYDTIQQVIL